ncbi:hypothetical protein EMIT053CA3_100127 [Pseudomonas donghuensis]
MCPFLAGQHRLSPLSAAGMCFSEQNIGPLSVRLGKLDYWGHFPHHVSDCSQHRTYHEEAHQ